MKIARALLAGASLLAPPAWAGEVSNVSGTLDTTLVDPAPSQYPHFICASGCSGGSAFNGAVTQSGVWSVGVSNFPASQAVNGTVSIGNFPANQAVTGTVSIGNFPANQAVTGTVSIANLPSTQAISASSLPLPAGAATAANQPALNADGGGLSHITNFPATQAVSGSVSVATSLPYGGNHLGSVSVDLPLPGFASPPTVNVGNTSLGVAATSGAFNDGWNATEGSTTDPAWTTGSGSMVSLLKANVGATTALASAVQGPTPPGSNVIGRVGLDQSSPGYTNAVELAPIPPTVSTTTEACHVLKSSGGFLFSLSGIAPNAEYILVFNTAAAPADGALSGANSPIWWYYVGVAGAWGASFPTPESLGTGITVCASSSGGFIKTALTGNVFSGQVQ